MKFINQSFDISISIGSQRQKDMFAFDGDMFLRIMVPLIVFEVATKINKRSFMKHVIPMSILFMRLWLISCATVYFGVMHGMQTPIIVELLSFLVWAFIPYFIIYDMVELGEIAATESLF